MEKVFEILPRLRIAFIRYGINDRKREGIPGCIDNLKRLCGCIQAKYQNVAVIIETGMWVDYPRHYMWDRNAALTPLYAAMRSFSEEAGYPLVDIFTNMRIETERGNWDLRVRGLPAPQHIIVDDTFDGFFGDDPAFFTNVHPNSRCLGLIADWEVSKLKELFGDELPGIANESSLQERKAKS
jgi:acyl-CoA thioesterase-1